MKTITIPIPDNVDDETISKATRVLQAFARPEWLMLFKFYTSQVFEIHCKGDTEPDIRALVRK